MYNAIERGNKTRKDTKGYFHTKTIKNDTNKIIHTQSKNNLSSNFIKIKEQSITIKSSSGLSDEEIEQMVKDAEDNAEADKKRREEIDLRNEADQLIFTTDKTIKDLEDKVSEEEKQKAEAAKDELKKALEGNDIEDIKAKKTALEEQVQQLSVKLYEQMAQEQQAQQGAEAENKSDDVVDADYEEVDDEKDKAEKN